MRASGNKALRIWQLALFAGLLLAWYVLTSPSTVPMTKASAVSTRVTHRCG